MDKEYINGFLNYLTSIYNYNKTNNPDFVMEPNMVYTLLITYGIVGVKENIEPLFNIWIDRFKERPGIKVFRTENWKYFCQFTNSSEKVTEAIKLYIPLKRHHMDENVTKIFEFLRSNNISHASKIAQEVRNDNVVIRVGNEEDAIKIIEFVNSDSEIKKALNPVSPLTMNYKGVGVTKDGNRSYNYELSTILAECLNKGMKLDYAKLSNYLKQKSDLVANPDLKMIYEIASKALKKTTITEICEIKKMREKNSDILYTALDATKEKYGVSQVVLALNKYIREHDSAGFTRGDLPNRNIRQELEDNLSYMDVLKIMESKIGVFCTIDEGIKKFINSIYADNISQEKEEKMQKENLYFETLKNIYATNGYYALIKAIMESSSKNKDLIRKIIEMSYPQMNANKINECFENSRFIYLIANLIKGYEDIQDKPKESKISYFNFLVKTYQEYGYTILLRQITKDLKSGTKTAEIKKIIKRNNPELTEEKINLFLNTGYGQQLLATTIKNYAEKDEKKEKQKV